MARYQALSLHTLSLQEAVGDLLKIKPGPKPPMEKSAGKKAGKE